LFGFESWDRETRRRSGGNVGISPPLRDFQGAVEREGILLLDFRAFHCPVISIRSPQVFSLRCSLLFQRAGGNGDSILHCSNSLLFASPIFRAHSVSLIFFAVLSSRSKLPPSFRYCPASGSDFSFSYGVW